MQNFINLQEKIDERASAITKALEREMKSLEEMEQTLNKRYEESVSNVINSLRNNMAEQEKELIKKKIIFMTAFMESEQGDVFYKMEKLNKEKMTTLNQWIETKHTDLSKKILSQNKEVLSILQQQKKVMKNLSLWTGMVSAIAIIVLSLGIAIGWYLQKPTEKNGELTQEDVMQVLKQSYTLHKTAEGWRLVEKQGRNY